MLDNKLESFMYNPLCHHVLGWHWQTTLSQGFRVPQYNLVYRFPSHLFKTWSWHIY